MNTNDFTRWYRKSISATRQNQTDQTKVVVAFDAKHSDRAEGLYTRISDARTELSLGRFAT
jgi:hypothetical protein